MTLKNACSKKKQKAFEKKNVPDPHLIELLGFSPQTYKLFKIINC